MYTELMGQFLAIIRGAPASGKTTIAKVMRSREKKVVWLKVDNFKDFFADESDYFRGFVDGSALATLEWLLDQGFSVVMEKIFLNPTAISKAIDVAKKRSVPSRVFQIKCSLATLHERDRNRPGVKEGCREPLGDKLIEEIWRKLEETFYEGAISLDTEKMSVEDCVQLIENNFH